MSVNSLTSNPYVDLLSNTTQSGPVAGPVTVQSTSDIDLLDDGGAPSAALSAGASALTAGGEIDGAALTPPDAYLAWEEQLAILANADFPSADAMLTLSEDLGVPRQTAVQDILDALGVTHAAENSPFLQDRMADLLVQSESMTREQLAGQLVGVSFMANTGSFFLPLSGMREHQVERQYVQQLMSLRNLSDPAARAAIQAEFQQRFAQAHGLDELQQDVRNSTRSFGEISGAEAKAIVDQVAAIHGPGEDVAHVSASDVEAIVAGVAGRPAADRTAALGAIAREMLARQAAGTLTIDANLQSAVEAAGAAG